MTTTAQRHAQTYRNLSVETAGPARIVLMLFDGADRFLSQALRGFEEESLAARNAAVTAGLVKAQRIVRELRRCLNLDAGGELALTLPGSTLSWTNKSTWRIFRKIARPSSLPANCSPKSARRRRCADQLISGSCC